MKPYESTNFELSAEWYPQRGTPSASSLKRRHEQTVTETTQEDPDGEADEERISPARTPAWGPSRFVGELHAMVSGGRLIVRQPVAQALRAFATCPNRQGLSRALPSIPDAQGFLDMLDLMLGQSPSGVPYSSFKTQEAVVSALVAHHSGAMGIAERTLNGKFATARRRLRSATV